MKFLQRFTKNINIAQADRASYRYLSICNNYVEELSYADARRYYKQKLIFLVPNCSTDFEFILSDFEIEDNDRIISFGLHLKITLFTNGSNNEKLRDVLTNIRTKYENEVAWSSNFVFFQIFKTCEAKLKEIFNPLVDTIESLSVKNLPVNDEIKGEVETLFLPFGKVELLDVKVLFRMPGENLPILEGSDDTGIFEETPKSSMPIYNIFVLLFFIASLGYLGFVCYKTLELRQDRSLAIEEDESIKENAVEIDTAKPAQDEIAKENVVEIDTAKPAQDEIAKENAVEIDTAKPAQDEIAKENVVEVDIAKPAKESKPKVDEMLEAVQTPAVEAPVAADSVIILNEYSLDFYLKSYMNFNDLKNALKSMDFVEYVSGQEVAGGFGAKEGHFKIKSAFNKNTLKEEMFKVFSLKNKSLKKSDIKLKQ